MSDGRKRAASSWRAMIQRCTNSKSVGWHRYGGRGITISDPWRRSFANFYADMGDRPEGMTLDRRDNDGNYEPGNCRWSTRAEQNRPGGRSGNLGGARAGAGAKPRGDVAMSEMLRAPVTPVQLEWSRHVAEASGVGVAEWLRSLVDQAISEHQCETCNAVLERARKQGERR